MKKGENKFKKSLALFISVLIILETFYLPVNAMIIDTESSVQQSSDSIVNNYNEDEDSTFNLVNSNVQIPDDYGSETDYISEVQISDYEQTYENGEEVIDSSTRATVGDPMVYLTQKWLNQEYGDVDGFGSVPENGKTGWDTVYGLLRALQHELGITSLANSFGPTTTSRYSQNLLYRQDGVTDRKFAILQGALWCKGYNPGYNLYELADGTVVFEEVFDATVEQAIIQLKTDAGLENPNGVVTVNVMKALMSMDSFKLLSSYGGDVKVREMQQKLNRKYEAYTGLTPCDGVYGRNTNKAVIYALQAEEGLPTSVANGNFGNTTKRCCPQIPYVKNSSAAKNYYGSYYSANTVSAMTELVQFALYVNGFGDGVTDGIFDEGTKQAIRSFQRKYAIPVTGIADKTTWLSLFISCGDTDRSAKAADCATILTAAKAKTLYDNGYRYIGRYLTGTYNGGISKAITREEAQIIFDAGLNFFPIYQTSARSNSYFTPEQGREDAKAAIEAAAALGVPTNTVIYFAVDYDCMDYEITSYVIPYFKAVHEGMVGSIYRVGIYGTRNACTRVSELGYACRSFVGDMSTGFSGNLGFSMPDNWAFDQFKTTTIGSGVGYLEIDKDGFSGRDYGVSRLDAPKTNTELPDITFGNPFLTDLNGPLVNILGHTTPLFKTPFGLNINLSDSVESEYDLKSNSYKVTIGLLESESDKSLHTENYAEIKEMIQFFGGHTTTSTWNKFQKIRSKLKKLPFDLGFGFDGIVAGYMEIDADTGVVREGGLIITAEATVSTEIPVYPPVVLQFSITGSIKGTLTFTQVNTNSFAPSGLLEFSLQLKGMIGLDVVIANTFAGASGTINCSIDSFTNPFSESFEADLNLKAHLELGFLLWAKSFEWQFEEWNLYPGTEAQIDEYSILKDDLEFINPLSSITSYSSNPEAYKSNVQVYCSPQIISLGNGRMLMAYIDDDASKSAENRTTLMYSIYNGTSWSVAAPVLNDDTMDYEPVICSDGNGGAHLLWQNSKEIFSSGVTMDEMATNMELYYTHWNGNTFENTVALTDNSDYEMGYKIISSGNEISVVWQQNSQNDPFSLDGNNAVYRKQYKNGVWQATETIATNLLSVTSMNTTYINGNNVIAFTAKSNSDISSIDDVELYYFDGELEQLTNDNVADISACFIDDTLYWISDSSVISITNGNINSKITVIPVLDSSVSEIKAIKGANGQEALVWKQTNGNLTQIYGSIYNQISEEFGSSFPLSTGDEVVRKWDACILSDNNIELAYCSAEMLEESVDGKPYGQLDLIQKSADSFIDIAVDQTITYNEIVLPNETITLSANVYNTGSKDITQLDVNVIDSEGIVVQNYMVDMDLPVGTNSTIEIPFALPLEITKSEYILKVMPYNETDISLENNQAFFTIGYSDLAIKNVEEVRNGNNRQLVVTIANNGYETADGIFKVIDSNGNGDVLSSKNIVQLSPGQTVEFTHSVDDSKFDESASGEPLLYKLKIESETDESSYINNNQDIYIFPDYAVESTAGAGGTVSGSGTYKYNSIVTLTATPTSGYIFAGWYENGKLLDNLTEEYSFEVLSNRTLEARFIPNNLAITDIEIFGVLETDNPLTFTINTDGGNQPYQWEVFIYKDDVLYSSDNIMVNFFEWTPIDAGEYSVVVNVTDFSNFNVSYSKEFIIV